MAKKYLVGEEVDGELVADLGPDYTTTRPPPVQGATRPEIPLLDSAVWKYKLGNDGEDDIFGSLTIACDIVFESRNIRSLQGDELQCTALVHCVEAVVPGDVLTIDGRDWPVQGIVRAAKDDNRITQWRTVAL